MDKGVGFWRNSGAMLVGECNKVINFGIINWIYNAFKLATVKIFKDEGWPFIRVNENGLFPSDKGLTLNGGQLTLSTC